jgi:hypothetical protein
MKSNVAARARGVDYYITNPHMDWVKLKIATIKFGG